jgi:hypothetical protein
MWHRTSSHNDNALYRGYYYGVTTSIFTLASVYVRNYNLRPAMLSCVIGPAAIFVIIQTL